MTGQGSPESSIASDRLSVAVEVSALGGPSFDRRCLVEFALDAMRADGSIIPATWSLRWVRRRDLVGGANPSLRGWLAARSTALGMAPRASWASPRAQVRFLASGPALIRLGPPGVVTIHSAAEALRIAAAGSSSRGAGAMLRRATDRGVIVHAASHAAGDAAVSELGLDRASVVVALPGLPATRRAAPPSTDSIGVVAGTSLTLDTAAVDSLRERGVRAELIAAGDAAAPRPCVVFASPGDGFPYAALEAFASGTPVVASRTPTTTELLEGAAVLVETRATTDLADAAAALMENGAHHGLVVAAGRARVGDFSCERRAPELISLLRRARSSR